MLTLLTILTACTRTPEPVAPAAPPADPPDASAAPIATPAPSPVGGWSSTSCGERSYERRIELREGGGFAGQERISPCPPGAACMWSGIHSFTGKWTLAEQTVTFTVSKTDAQGEQAEVWPEALTWAGGRLLEGDCAYAPMKIEDDGPR